MFYTNKKYNNTCNVGRHPTTNVFNKWVFSQNFYSSFLFSEVLLEQFHHHPQLVLISYSCKHLYCISLFPILPVPLLHCTHQQYTKKWSLSTFLLRMHTDWVYLFWLFSNVDTLHTQTCLESYIYISICCVDLGLTGLKRHLVSHHKHIHLCRCTVCVLGL